MGRTAERFINLPVCFRQLSFQPECFYRIQRLLCKYFTLHQVKLCGTACFSWVYIVPGACGCNHTLFMKETRAEFSRNRLCGPVGIIHRFEWLGIGIACL